jgi:hypothetical protein
MKNTMELLLNLESVLEKNSSLERVLKYKIYTRKFIAFRTLKLPYTISLLLVYTNKVLIKRRFTNKEISCQSYTRYRIYI